MILTGMALQEYIILLLITFPTKVLSRQTGEAEYLDNSFVVLGHPTQPTHLFRNTLVAAEEEENLCVGLQHATKCYNIVPD